MLVRLMDDYPTLMCHSTNDCRIASYFAHLPWRFGNIALCFALHEPPTDIMLSTSVFSPADVFMIEATFPRGIQTSNGGRVCVYKVMAAKAALRIEGEQYIWYGDPPADSPAVEDKSPNANVPLYVKVCAQLHDAVLF